MIDNSLDFLNEDEQWMPIRHYPDYQVSSHGRVRSIKSGNYKILKPQDNVAGYLRVGLYKRGKMRRYFVHRLVCCAFFGYKKKLQVNHKDFNRKNNFKVNLEWCTASQNILHSKQRLKKLRNEREECPF